MIDHRQQCARMASYFSLVQTIYVLFSALLACIFSTPLAQGVLVGGLSIIISQNVARHIATGHQHINPHIIFRRMSLASVLKILIFSAFLYVVFMSRIFNENYVLLGLINVLTTYFWAWIPVEKYERNS